MLASVFSPSDLHENTASLVADLAVKSSTSGEHGGSGSEAPRHILLIEDDHVIAEMYRYQLEADGHQVTIAYNGRRGWEMLSEGRPDLVLLDLRMPGMDGFQVLEAMRGDETLGGVPVVVLSNFGDANMMSRAQSLGVTDFLVKSRVTPEQISRRVRTWIAGEPLN